MSSKKRLIYADDAQHIADVELTQDDSGTIQYVLSHTPTVDAVETSEIEKQKQEALQWMDEYISEWKGITQSYIDVWRARIEAMEIAKQLVNRYIFVRKMEEKNDVQ